VPSLASACDDFQALRLDVRFIFGLLPTDAASRYPYNYLKTSGLLGLSQGKFSGADFLLPNPEGRSPKTTSPDGRETCMGRQIRVRAITKEEPEIGLYVLALIALARQIQDEDKRQAAQSAAHVALAEPGEEASHAGA
jgi:hypothetical protein